MLLLSVLPLMAQSAPPATQPGRIRGVVVDKDGAAIPNVLVTLTPPGSVRASQTTSSNDGTFVFANVAPGPFQLSFASTGFALQHSSGVLQPGEDQLMPQVTLAIGSTEEDVKVTVTPEEIATDQVHVEEKQRLMGVIPNFYVTYDQHPAPLTTRLKFELAWKSTIDPVSFGIVGIIAGFEQADNTFAGYGQGAQGYGKRFGAGFADSVHVGGGISAWVSQIEPDKPSY